MPVPHRRDAAAADRLALASSEALDASLEVLDHYADTGERLTDRAVNDLAEQAADLLRAVSEAMAEWSDPAVAHPLSAAVQDLDESRRKARERGRRLTSRADDGFGASGR